MAYRRIIQLLVLSPLLVTMSCAQTAPSQPTPSPRPNPAKENQHPGMPKIELSVTMRSPEEAYVAVRFAAKSTDVENDKIAYTYEWYRNGELTAFPRTQTDTVINMGSDTNPDPFAVEVSDVTWKVIVTPRDPYGVGATAVASTTFVLTRGCEPFPKGYILVDCNGEYVFSSPLTDAISVAPNAQIMAIQNVIAQHILGADGTPGHSRFRNFVDRMLKLALSTPPLQPLPFDPDTYQYTGSPGDLAAIRFSDISCVDIPLTGHTCVNGFFHDVDNEPGELMMDFGPVAAWPIKAWGLPVTEASPSENGVVSISSLGASVFEVTLQLSATQIDLLWEPPIDPMVTDIANNSVNYLPEMDLSTYLKAYGHAELGRALELKFKVSVPSTFDRLHFSLLTFRRIGNDLQLIFRKGPYCNNNLGTTETPFAGTTSFRLNPNERPFDTSGVPLFPGFFSDTVSGAQGGNALLEYYAQEIWPYPHTESNINGGSGVGRDRIGVGSWAYGFDIAQGMFSDNPNNCVRPADACMMPGVQDGGVEWTGVSASCEYPNISNNKDDSTYKISEQITTIIPYIQYELKSSLDNIFMR